MTLVGWRFLILPVLFFWASAFAQAAVSGDLKKVILSYSAVSMTWFPVKVAVEKGFFRSEGLEPQLIQMNGNVATVALANGHIDFSLNISPVLNGAMQGLGTKLVAALNSRPLFALVVRPEITSASELKGKVFAAGPHAGAHRRAGQEHCPGQSDASADQRSTGE